MVSRLAYNIFVLEEATGTSGADFEALVTTVTRLWANALQFRPNGN
jgi:hypothetical protein